MTALFKGYVVDTDAIINLVRRHYPADVFATVHANIEQMINEGTFVSCAEVLNELEAGSSKIVGSDVTLDWAHAHGGIFAELDEQEELILVDIMDKHGGLVKLSAPSGYDADAMLIARAASKGWKLITYESGGDPNKVKIPDVARHYDVTCINLVDFFKETGWSV